MNKKDFISRTEFNQIPITDFLSAMGVSYLEQVQSLRHYDFCELISDGNEQPKEHLLTVNVQRNEWIDRDDRSRHGLLSDLLVHVHSIPNDFDGNYAECMEYMLDKYRELETLPKVYPVTGVRLGTSGKDISDHIGDCVHAMMALRGISRHTVDKYCKQLDIHGGKGTGPKEQLAFPADNGNWYIFGGTSWQPLVESCISTIGEFRKNQCCYVYENPMDFLAMMERWHRNRAELAMGSTYHLIINGRRNSKTAQQFIKDNPDFLEVKTFFSETTDGRQLFAEINNACKGTAVNCSYIFDLYESLSDQERMRAPMAIRQKYLMTEKTAEETLTAQKAEKMKSENALVSAIRRQTEQLEKERWEREQSSDKLPKGKGETQVITIEPKGRGFKL